MSKLAGRVAWVTGAGRGIGRATALALAELGAKVAPSARTRGEVEGVAEEVGHHSGIARSFVCDVSDWQSVWETKERVVSSLGPPDILVNNAGVLGPLGKTWETSPAEWLHTIEINLVGAYYCTRAALPKMVSQGHGSIVNVSSAAAAFPLSNWTAYAASKAGLDFFTRSLATELKGTGVQVCALYPGVVDTAMVEKLRTASPEELPPKRREFFEKVTAKEELLQPEKVGKVIAWLASVEASDLNGAVLDLQKEASLMEKALREFEEWKSN